MHCSDYLENRKDSVFDTRYWITYIHYETLINDICWKCETILDCGYHEHILKLQRREKAEREKEILNKLLTK